MAPKGKGGKVAATVRETAVRHTRARKRMSWGRRLRGCAAAQCPRCALWLGGARSLGGPGCGFAWREWRAAEPPLSLPAPSRAPSVPGWPHAPVLAAVCSH